MNESVLKRIGASKKTLASVSAALKHRFVGLDHIIDNIIDNMMVWHAMPELIGRPVIINLWGMTGVGKTDLVRHLAKELGIVDRFVEIQMSNKSQSGEDSIQKVLSRSSIEPDSQGILLLDEIQRYRTVQEDGSEIHDHDFQDVWMLLSDGRFSGNSRTKTEIMDMLIEDMYWRQVAEEHEEEEAVEAKSGRLGSSPPVSPNVSPKRKTPRKYKMGLYSARELKRTLRLKEGIDEIMQWDEPKRYSLIESSLNDQSTYEGHSYKQLLIFISGNLDEAYEMSGDTGNADIDADIFHEFSTRINLVTIKRVLRSKFKPEQIARLGNVHVIYPSLNQESYREIIRRKVQELIDGVKEYGVDFEIGQSVYDAIYRNGVFPAQGVRPVLSSVTAMLANAIPHFFLAAAELGQTMVCLQHSEDREELIATIGGKEYCKSVEGSIDRIKKNYDKNRIALTAVHEAGHAIVYAELFNLAPLQIIANTSTDDVKGWVGIHKNCHSKDFVRIIICVNLAGLAAEEFIFGDGDRTDGCSLDIMYATSLAGHSIRNWAMNGHLSLRVNKHQDGNVYNYDLDSTNGEIENILKEEKERASIIMKRHKTLFAAVTDALIQNKELSPQKFQALAKANSLDIDIKSAKETVYSDYVEQFDRVTQLSNS